MKVGDLAHMSKSMLKMNYPEFGVVIGMKGVHYIVAFPNGVVQPFHPKWIKEIPIEEN